MINGYLLNDTIADIKQELFLEGMQELNAIERGNDCHFWKVDSIWELPVVIKLYSSFGPIEQVIMKFIEQLASIELEGKTGGKLDANFCNDLNCFLGIDFSKTSIVKERQVVDQNSFEIFLKQFYVNFEAEGDKSKIRKALNFLYPNYHFDERAIEDVTYWNENDLELYKRLLNLLSDVQANPFQGGIGKTEALKWSRVASASKRLDHGHRITYTLKKNRIRILACKGHYD